MESELDYYSRRVAEELRAASRATSPERRIRHRTLAEHYAMIVQEAANRPETRS